jgi:hypothetical protein
MMRVKHTKKLRNHRYILNGAEPEIGYVVEVSNELGLHLIARGWGEEATRAERPPTVIEDESAIAYEEEDEEE